MHSPMERTIHSVSAAYLKSSTSFPGLFPFRAVARRREKPWERGCEKLTAVQIDDVKSGSMTTPPNVDKTRLKHRKNVEILLHLTLKTFK